MPNLLTIGETAALLNVDDWRVRRLFENGILPEPERFAEKRVIREEILPGIIAELQNRGCLESDLSLPSL